VTALALANLLSQLDPVNDKRKGDQFEHICKWFLENDPVYRAKFVQVWHFTEWPRRWSNVDLGTDLIAEDTDGKFWAIQAKAYGQRTTVTKTHTDSFLSDSSRDVISYRMLIATTERVGANATATSDGQVKPVTYVMRSRLEAAQVGWPEDLADLAPPVEPLPRAEPRDFRSRRSTRWWTDSPSTIAAR
jgi:predicted helicase